MSGSKIDIPPPLPGAVPLIGIFGRTLSNVPDYSMSGGKNSQQNCADSITLMKNRHRNGTTENLYLLTTYHEETDRNRLLEEYSVTSELKQFILGIFPLVLKHGIITDRNYHFEDYWIVTPDYDDKNHVIKLCAKCLKEHTMRTVDGDIHIGEG